MLEGNDVMLNLNGIFAKRVLGKQSEKIQSNLYTFYNNTLKLPDLIDEHKIETVRTLVETLPAQEIYGHFYDHQHYLNALKILENSTNETEHRLLFFEQQILPELYRSQRLLDVGTGNGKLHNLMFNQFEDITVVNKEQSLIKQSTTIEQALKNYRCIHSEIEDAELSEDYYDLAVLSHVLYYVEQQKHFHCIEKMFKSLRRGGKLVIVLTTDLDKSNLAYRFQGRLPNVGNIIQRIVHELPAKIEHHATDIAFVSNDMKPMMCIAGIILHDGHTYAIREQLEEYLATVKKNKKPYYRIYAKQNYIILTKL